MALAGGDGGDKGKPPVNEKRKLGDSRQGKGKKKLLADGGGNEKTEAAVAAGLKWLASQQKPEGTWEFTGAPYKERRVAATGFALLCFFGAGHAPKDGGPYGNMTATGVAALRKLQDEKTGAFRTLYPYMYEHAIGTLALVEAYAMTGDERLKQPCQRALDLILKVQAKDGGWRYELKPGIPLGDVSVTGWAVQALAVAKRYTDLEVPDEALAQASKFLDTCAKGPKKAAFSYVSYANADPFKATTASGLCSKIALDGWKAGNERLVAGVGELLKRVPDPAKKTDPYFLYYATRAVYCHGGAAWIKDWNPKVQTYLLKTQEPDGTWPSGSYPYVSGIGRLGVTCFHLLTLETYYRYAPPG
jgi:hypothetical protein